MKLMGKLTKESRSLNATVSPRSGGGGRVQDVVYGSASGESVVNDEGVAIIPPYPTIPPIPVKGVQNDKGVNLVNDQGIAIIPTSAAKFDLLAGNTDQILPTGNVTLAHSLNDYDCLIFCLTYITYYYIAMPPTIVPIDYLKTINERLYVYYNGGNWYCDVKYIDENTITIFRNSNVAISKIYGVKF